MLNRILLAVGVVSGVVGACIYSSIGEETVARATVFDSFDVKQVKLEEVTGVVQPEVHTAFETEKYDALRAYLLESLRAWMHEKSTNDNDLARYTSTADAVAAVALTETPAWDADINHAKTAIVVLGLGWMETRDREYVERGWCNNLSRADDGTVTPYKWRKSKNGISVMSVGGACDGGYAYSRWQLHPEGGLAFSKNDVRHYLDVPGVSPADIITGEKLIESKEIAARVAWRIVRRSIRAGAGLCQYSGEPGPCPKADLRLKFGLGWFDRHPFGQ